MTPIPTKLRRARSRRTSDQWQELFDRFARSGLTREQFCRKQGVSLSSFDRWRTKLRKGTPIASPISEPPLFAELTAPPAATTSPTWDIELQLGADVFLRLRRPC